MNSKHFLLWLPLIVIAFINGTIRQLIIAKYFNELRAHQLSTITLIILSSIFVFLIFPFLNIKNTKQAFLIGLLWVFLTVIFEFTLGITTKKSWAILFQDYNIITGHFWPIFLLCLFLLPFLCYILKRKKSRNKK